MKNFKSHPHKYREQKIQELIPILKEKLGDNFVALGVGGSYTRNEDHDYSDLELVAFTKIPAHEEAIRKIKDGMLVVVVFETEDDYIQKYLDISDVWYASGADKLEAIINEEFIQKLNNYVPDDIEEKCLQQISNKWFNFQEISAKTLNMIIEDNHEGFPIIFNQMIKEVLIILAYLNQTPYTTLKSYIPEARKFNNLPKSFNALIKLVVEGNYDDLSIFDESLKIVISDLEIILQDKGLEL